MKQRDGKLMWLCRDATPTRWHQQPVLVFADRPKRYPDGTWSVPGGPVSTLCEIAFERITGLHLDCGEGPIPVAVLIVPLEE